MKLLAQAGVSPRRNWRTSAGQRRRNTPFHRTSRCVPCVTSFILPTSFFNFNHCARILFH
ncbi:hypothetical protein WH47_02303 [Habropoda laboriosa]|uniref:Uncharacterized protein n=1 Tax=Habropoda laboriosa TaxID=597456 RepID=A0A0L7QYD3_9HYME|nr:hypothetical protein WH47_02303 [Habropoda laboriosa]